MKLMHSQVLLMVRKRIKTLTLDFIMYTGYRSTGDHWEDIRRGQQRGKWDGRTPRALPHSGTEGPELRLTTPKGCCVAEITQDASECRSLSWTLPWRCQLPSPWSKLCPHGCVTIFLNRSLHSEKTKSPSSTVVTFPDHFISHPPREEGSEAKSGLTQKTSTDRIGYSTASQLSRVSRPPDLRIASCSSGVTELFC